MNNEKIKFHYKIRQVLNQSTNGLAPTVVARLRDSRQNALKHQQIAVGGLTFAGLGHFANETVPAHARMLLAAFALILGVMFTYYWNVFEQAAENAEIDSALLSDDLPPAAFLDKGFHAWLESSSQSSQ